MFLELLAYESGLSGNMGWGVCVSLLLAPYHGAYTQWVLSVHFSSHVEFNLTPGKKKEMLI